MHQTSLCHTPFLDKWVCPVRQLETELWRSLLSKSPSILSVVCGLALFVAFYQKFLTTYTLVSKTPLNFIQMLKDSYHFKNLLMCEMDFFLISGGPGAKTPTDC